MRLLIALIVVLSFPALEIYTLVQIYQHIGWWIIALLAGAALAGWLLIVEERLAFFARLVMTVQAGGSPLRALFESGRTMVAGALLIFPGVISDMLAILVLLIPARLFGRRAPRHPPGTPGVIEGECRREVDEWPER